MQFQPAYNRLNDWLRSLSVLQGVLVIWLVAIIVSVPVGVVFAGNTLTTAVTSGIGGLLALQLSRISWNDEMCHNTHSLTPGF